MAQDGATADPRWCMPDMAPVRRFAVHKATQHCLDARSSDAPDVRARAVRRWPEEAEQRVGVCDDPAAFLKSPIFAKFVGRSWFYPALCDAVHSYGGCYARAVEFFQTLLLVGIMECMHATQCLLHYYLKAARVEMSHARRSACDPLQLWSEAAQGSLSADATKLGRCGCG
mmetsp:Transcript_30524/g.76359  ORF Transcript_30524/g.76359 Transcript_30524/m.76359 type:complete len:171 (+) Transcript_30524:383-895(+)